MNNTEILLIRACKSYVPKPRLLSVHRRFYGKFSEAEAEQALNYLLSEICQKYNLLTVKTLVQTLPRNHNNLLSTLTAAIRFCKVTKFPEDIRHKNKN